MEKLITITDFILEVSKELHSHTENYDRNEMLHKIINYANFLKQPLTLGMFVPIDSNGYIFEQPDFMSGDYDNNGFGDVDKYKYKEDLEKFELSKSNVLFNGFKIDRYGRFFCLGYLGISIIHEKINFDTGVKTIEDICNKGLFLTESAKKQILGL